MLQLLNKKLKLGKKGFSLVELIIVIAIMAVLVAILLPQYLQYVDKSRQSKDDANANTLLNAVQVAMSDDTLAQAVAALTANPTVVFSSANVAITNDTATNQINAALVASLGTGYNTKMVLTSTKYKAAGSGHSTYTITIDRTTAAVSGVWS